MAKIRRTPNYVRKPIEKARERYEASMSAVYATATHGHMPFNECRKLASDAVRAEHEAASRALSNAEHEACCACQMWRDNRGHARYYE